MSFRNILKPHSHKKPATKKVQDEREIEREIRKLESLEDNSKKLYKDMKRCNEAQAVQNKCECRTVQNLASSSVCRDSAKMQQVVQRWQETTQRLDTLTQDLSDSSQKTVAEPMKKFGTIFPSVANAARKREQYLQEYVKCQSKMEKYQEKERTGSVLVKREAAKKALSNAKDDYDSQTSALLEDMPRLYESRIDYVEPSFQALVKAQIKYYTEAHKAYSELEAEISTDNRNLSNEDFILFAQQKLTDIRALSITADD